MNEMSPKRAKLFWSGRSQAVRLPKEFRFDGAEVKIRREEDGSINIAAAAESDDDWVERLAGTMDDETARIILEERPGPETMPEVGASTVIEYLLDTNIITFWLNQAHRPLLQRMKWSRERSALSSIVVHELYFGAYKSTKKQQNLHTYDQIGFCILDFDRGDARVAGEIRAALRAKGVQIGPYDIMIAGQALARDLTLVTNNTREFARVDGLRLEDWTTA